MSFSGYKKYIEEGDLVIIYMVKKQKQKESPLSLFFLTFGKVLTSNV